VFRLLTRARARVTVRANVFKRFLTPLVLGVIIAAGVVDAVVPGSRAGAGSAADASDTGGRPAAATSLTAKAVAAANAFKASLSSSQRTAVQYPFSSPAKEKGWSNLPIALLARPGVKVSDLDATQRAKLRTLLQTILSSQGFSDEEGTRKADRYLRKAANSEPGGPPGDPYAQGLFYVALFGTPSTSKKWTVQFGGHHLAIHMTFSGSAVSNTPYFAGVEPTFPFKLSGKRYAPMEDEVASLFGAVRSLDASQREQAKLSKTFDDVLVGPQDEGQFPEQEGPTVSSLSAAQQALVTKAIRAYVGDMPTAEANARMELYTSQYPRTTIAWSKSMDPQTIGAYVRIHGPRLWIEICVESPVILRGVHYHSVERDIKTDYGAGT
jgi:Protein of unknown function (DUF3500)